MIRLHFTAADLRQITLAPGPNALLETALSLRALRGSAGGTRVRPGLARWHREVSGSAAARAKGLLDLVPRQGYVPDFLLQPAAPDFAAALEAARDTPAPQLAADLEPLGESVRSRRWLRDLADGTDAARGALAGHLHAYHRSTIAPVWPQVLANVSADRALRAEMLLRGGIDALLTTLNPRWMWQPPTLHIPAPASYDVPLCGRGLHLIPSYFATGPALMYRPTNSVILAYPTPAAPAGRQDRAETAGALAPLIGHTRATVLTALRTPATTTTLAERAGISLASASQHAAVLRNAGLITTHRTGPAVLHTLHPLGRALLDPPQP